MISPDEIRARARKIWMTGAALRGWLGTESLFPYAVPFRKPSAQEWLAHFSELRAEVEKLEAGSRARTGAGYTVEYREVAHQKLGRLKVPEIIFFESAQDLAACAGETAALARFAEVAQLLRSREPRLADWLAAQPLRALEVQAALPRLLAVVAYFQANPRPMRYARELGIPGVDSKFIEENRALLATWLDRLLPADAIDPSAQGLAADGFEKRFGLRYDEPLIRFRWLDRSCVLGGAIADATVPLSQFSAYSPHCERVFVTENRVNFLTFPECSGSLVIFGGGYAIDRLGSLSWLGNQPLYYWGDIDTHGFAILSRLRGYWGHTHSFLMDRDTLLAHEALWSEEPGERRCLHDLSGLNSEELTLYDDLRADRLRGHVRLEQERVGYAQVEATLRNILQREAGTER